MPLIPYFSIDDELCTACRFVPTSISTTDAALVRECNACFCGVCSQLSCSSSFSPFSSSAVDPMLRNGDNGIMTTFTTSQKQENNISNGNRDEGQEDTLMMCGDCLSFRAHRFCLEFADVQVCPNCSARLLDRKRKDLQTNNNDNINPEGAHRDKSLPQQQRANKKFTTFAAKKKGLKATTTTWEDDDVDLQHDDEDELLLLDLQQQQQQQGREGEKIEEKKDKTCSTEAAGAASEKEQEREQDISTSQNVRITEHSREEGQPPLVCLEEGGREDEENNTTKKKQKLPVLLTTEDDVEHLIMVSTAPQQNIQGSSSDEIKQTNSDENAETKEMPALLSHRSHEVEPTMLQLPPSLTCGMEELNPFSILARTDPRVPPIALHLGAAKCLETKKMTKATTSTMTTTTTTSSSVEVEASPQQQQQQLKHQGEEEKEDKHRRESVGGSEFQLDSALKTTIAKNPAGEDVFFLRHFHPQQEQRSGGGTGMKVEEPKAALREENRLDGQSLLSPGQTTVSATNNGNGESTSPRTVASSNVKQYQENHVSENIAGIAAGGIMTTPGNIRGLITVQEPLSTPSLQTPSASRLPTDQAYQQQQQFDRWADQYSGGGRRVPSSVGNTNERGTGKKTGKKERAKENNVAVEQMIRSSFSPIIVQKLLGKLRQDHHGTHQRVDDSGEGTSYSPEEGRVLDLNTSPFLNDGQEDSVHRSEWRGEDDEADILSHTARNRRVLSSKRRRGKGYEELLGGSPDNTNMSFSNSSLFPGVREDGDGEGGTIAAQFTEGRLQQQQQFLTNNNNEYDHEEKAEMGKKKRRIESHSETKDLFLIPASSSSRDMIHGSNSASALLGRTWAVAAAQARGGKQQARPLKQEESKGEKVEAKGGKRIGGKLQKIAQEDAHDMSGERGRGESGARRVTATAASREPGSSREQTSAAASPNSFEAMRQQRIQRNQLRLKALDIEPRAT